MQDPWTPRGRNTANIITPPKRLFFSFHLDVSRLQLVSACFRAARLILATSDGGLGSGSPGLAQANGRKQLSSLKREGPLAD